MAIGIEVKDNRDVVTRILYGAEARWISENEEIEPEVIPTIPWDAKNNGNKKGFEVTKTYTIDGYEGDRCGKCCFQDRFDLQCEIFFDYLPYRIEDEEAVLFRHELCILKEKEWKS